MISIYNFDNYRVFLRAYYQSFKAADPSYSYRRFSQLAGIQAPNLLKLVMDGDRDLTLDNIHRFARALDLKGMEIDYFEACVHAAQAADKDVRDFYQARMAKLKSKSEGLVRPLGDRRSIGIFWEDASNATALLLAHLKPRSEAEGLIERASGKSKAETSAFLDRALREGYLSEKEGVIEANFCQLQITDRQKGKRLQRFLAVQIEESKAKLPLFFEKPYATFLTNIFTVKNIYRLEEFNRTLKDDLQRAQSDLDADLDHKVVAKMSIQIYPIAYEDPTS